MSIDEKARDAAIGAFGQHVWETRMEYISINPETMDRALEAYEAAKSAGQPEHADDKPVASINKNEGNCGSHTQQPDELPDFIKLLDLLADACANGWEYGVHPKDKARVILERIRPYLRTPQTDSMFRAAGRIEGATQKRESIDPSLYDELYFAAENAISYINRHPYGQPIAGRIRRALQAIVAAKLSNEQGRRG